MATRLSELLHGSTRKALLLGRQQSQAAGSALPLDHGLHHKSRSPGSDTKQAAAGRTAARQAEQVATPAAGQEPGSVTGGVEASAARNAPPSAPSASTTPARLPSSSRLPPHARGQGAACGWGDAHALAGDCSARSSSADIHGFMNPCGISVHVNS